MRDFTPTKPTFAIQSLKVENFKGIKSLEIDGLPDNANWVFITGENGFGKTSILQAITLGLYGFEGHTHEFEEKPELNIECKAFGEKINLERIEKGKEKFKTTPDSQYNDHEIKGICCYGSVRLNMAQADFKQEMSPTRNLFETTTFLRNIEHQLSRWFFKQHNTGFKEKYEFVTTILIEMLGVDRISVDENTDEVFYFEKDKEGNVYEKLPSKQLASGYRSIIGMVGDMILRLFETQPNVTNPKDLVGIVLIDELDLHFHPKLQKKLPSLFSKIFPKIQFIASTHSPIPLLGAPLNSVFLRVNRTVEDGITLERLEEMERELPDLLPNSILSSPIFNMHEIFPVTHNPKNRIRTEDTYSEIKLNNAVEERLEGFLSEEQEKSLLDQFKTEKK